MSVDDFSCFKLGFGFGMFDRDGFAGRQDSQVRCHTDYAGFRPKIVTISPIIYYSAARLELTTKFPRTITF